MKRIYYFSGTGNSLRAAQRIAKELGDTEIVSMRCKPEEVPAIECEVVGFIYPVYHWTLPEPVTAFVKQLKINPNTYVFTVAMPSLVCGLACEHLEELLKEKKIKISYGAKVANVANYCLVYPPFPSEKIMLPKAERKLTKIAEDIRNYKTAPIPKCSKFIRSKYKRVMPKYKALQKYADRPFTIADECIACGICEKICPCHNITMKEGKPTFQGNCAQCMACVSYCPKKAIGYELSEEDIRQLGELGQNLFFAKIMKLPKGRKRYHNPYIKASDLMKEKISIEGRKEDAKNKS